MMCSPSQTLSNVQHSSSELRYDLRECRTQLCRVLGPILQKQAKSAQNPSQTENWTLKRRDLSKRPSRDASGSTLTGLLAAIWSHARLEVFQLAESLRRGSYIGRPKLTGGRPRRLRRNCRTALYLSARAGSACNSVRATKRTSQVLSRAAPSAARLRPGDHRGHAAACDGSRTRTAALNSLRRAQARTAAFNRKSLRRAPSSDRGE